MPNLFKKLFASKKEVQTKGFEVDNALRTSTYRFTTDKDALVSFLFFGQSSFTRSIDYYEKASPVSTAIDLISQEFKNIRPLIWNASIQDFDFDHDLLKLLNNPNQNQTRQDFLENLSSFFLITGNTFFIATGDVDREPLELFVVNPLSVQGLETMEEGKLNNAPENIQIIIDNRVVNFKREFNTGRFISDNRRMELFMIKKFNPKSNSIAKGRSKLGNLSLEIEQFIEASLHNISLLARGGQLGQVLKPDPNTPVTPETLDRLRQEFSVTQSGASNAGKSKVLPPGFDIKDMGMSNKDMDFAELKKQTLIAIFNAYNIPLPLISPEQMTLANMATAKISLYDNAILPLTRELYASITKMLLPRYQNSESLELTYDQNDIQALMPRTIDIIERLSATGITTRNELRAMIGKEAAQGLDEFLLPANLIPQGSDEFTQDQPEKPRPRSAKKMIAELLAFQKRKDEDAVEVA